MILEENGKAIGAFCLKRISYIRELSFEEILLDETLVEGDIWIWKEALKDAGGINYRLNAKRAYELLLRTAKKYRVFQYSFKSWEDYLSQENMRETEKWVYITSDTAICGDDSEFEESLKTDCYLIGRYKEELCAMGYLGEAISGIISAWGAKGKQYLKQMVNRTEAFYEIYDCTQPILVYMGGDMCFRVLQMFSIGLGRALEDLGQHVEYFDISKQEIQELASYQNKRLKAVIGMQTYLFSAGWRTQDGKWEFVHDKIAAPQYQFIFDHPIRMKDSLKKIPNRLCILELDGNYVNFIRTYYGHEARFLPPAGESGTLFHDRERDYGVTFLGSCGKDVLEYLQLLKKCDKSKARFMNRYVLYMRRDLREVPEHAFRRTMDYYEIAYTDQEFVERFYEERGVILLLALYYRRKVIQTLLEAGIHVHVFGESWKESLLYGHPCLICHEAVVGQDALKIYARSKISLNIMMWHKDGFTERIANAMLQKSVVVTDTTTYLEKNFVNGEELVLFDLGHLNELPVRIRALLDDDEKRMQIAENGFQNAIKNHTWDRRAGRLLELIEEDRAHRSGGYRGMEPNDR